MQTSTAPMPINRSARVAYLGPQGTFSHAAAIAFFGSRSDGFADSEQLVPFGSIESVFGHVEQNKAAYGVVPVENSTEGAVNNTQDCLLDTGVRIEGEIVLPIEHNLLAPAGTSLASLHTIASHKQSLAQCRRWIANNLPELALKECLSNAQAAELATNEPGVAAIAGSFAAQTYGLDSLATSIQDHLHNRTRFLIIKRRDLEGEQEAGGAHLAVGTTLKTSLVIATENKPGALFRLLKPFDTLQVDLTKIESRPSKKRAWEYVFFLDFVTSMTAGAQAEGERATDTSLIARLLESLKPHTTSLTVLGTYPVAASAQGSLTAEASAND